MAKINVKNIKKNKNKKSNSSNEKSIKGQKEKELKEAKRKQKIIHDADIAISELENEIKNSGILKKQKKEDMIHSLDKLKTWIDEDNIDELESWLNTYNELKEMEEKENKEKENYNKKSFGQVLKENFTITRIPIYSRVKTIINSSDSSKMKGLKFLGIFAFSLLLIAVCVIGVLIIAGTIPFLISNFQNSSSIFGGILIAISIGLFYFI